MVDVLEKEDAVGKEKTFEEWDSVYNLHWSYVSEHLGRIADVDIDTLLDALKKGCDVVRICVADALGRVGTGDEKRIMARWYLHGIETTRRENVDERVVPALIEMLEVEEETDERSWAHTEISRNAAKSLCKLRDERAVPTLIKCLDREWDVRNEAARALGKIGDKSTVPRLIKALPLGDAAYALGRIRDESAIPALKEELECEIEDVEEHGHCDSHWKSARALCELGDVGLTAIVDVVRPYMKAQKSFDKLVEIVKKERTDDEDYGYNEDPLALELCDLYYKLQKEPVIIPVLLYLMKHGSSGYRSSDVSGVAAQMVCLLNDKNIQHLIDLLQDDDVRVRSAAVRLGSRDPEYLEERLDLSFEVYSWYDETDQLLEVLKDDTLIVYYNIRWTIWKAYVPRSGGYYTCNR
ncbi:MAG: HEAT repeat domain-containing protein [Euryarchaeota archaeon]|nr:HEAT repeat domain-containing protein [Euryarchaeota archaeon]